jgi:putative chitobiose transport system permease protein
MMTSGFFIRNRTKLRSTVIAWAFMAPALAILLVFVFYPILFSIPLAFTNYSVFDETRFTGLTNFRRLLADRDFWKAFTNSCLFIIVVPILQLLALVLALVVNRKMWGVTVFKVLFYLPVVTSMVAVAIIWKFIFDPNGVLNATLMQIGLIKQPIRFISSVQLALPTMMAITIWQGLGYYMMIYLSALQTFPEELIDSATLDGAGVLRVFWHIRLPLLQPQIWFCAMVSVIAAIGIFDVVFTMTDGGPDKATYVINFYAYHQAFKNFNFGYSAAIGIVLALLTSVFSVFLNVYNKKGGGNFYG